MRAILVTLLASLAVIFALFVLVSEDPRTRSHSGLTIHGQRVSELGDLLEGIMVQHKRRLDERKTPNPTIAKAQRALKADGFYSGSIDGTMTESTRQAIQSFQEANRLNATGNMDDETARRLGLSRDDSRS